jgi:hypothetical protein
VIQQVPGILDQPAVTTRMVDLAPQFVVIEAAFWCDTERGTDLARVRTAAMEQAKTALRNAGFTLSSEVSQAIDLRGRTAA